MMAPRTIALPALLAVLALALTGCGRGTGDLEDYVAEVKSRPGPPLDPLPVMQQFETFEYAAQDLRDPFSNAFTDEGSGAGPRPDPNRPRQALEQFPLDALVMVGTLGTGSGMQALVMAPDKVTYRVRPGVYVGQSDGQVLAIHEDRIELVELVPDGTGGWLERPASIAIEE